MNNQDKFKEGNDFQKIDIHFQKWLTHAIEVFQGGLRKLIDVLNNGEWEKYVTEESIMELRLGLSTFLRNDANTKTLTRDETNQLYNRIRTCLDEPDLLIEELSRRMVDLDLAEGKSPLPGCKLVKKLGEGGYGEVWEAETHGNVRIALKFIPRTGNSDHEIEFQVLQEIKDIRHANIVPITAIWQNTNPRYAIYQMPLSESALPQALGLPPEKEQKKDQNTVTLSHNQTVSFGEVPQIRSKPETATPSHKKTCKPNELRPYFRDAAAALDCLNHPAEATKREAIMHGDIKPANIFVNNGSAQLGDFGSVSLIKNNRPSPFTPAFAAPERLGLHPQNSVHSDQFSLAVSWYYLRTGKFPYSKPLPPTRTVDSDYYHQLRETLCSLNLSGVPRRERKVLAKALSPSPSKRYATNTAFVTALTRPANFLLWTIAILLIALTTVFAAQNQIAKQKLAQERKIEEQRIEEKHQKYVAIETGLCMEMEAQFFFYETRFLAASKELADEWEIMIENIQKAPNKRKYHINKFIKCLEQHVQVWQFEKEHEKKDVLPLPKEADLKILQENGVSMEEFEVFYTTLHPRICEGYDSYLITIEMVIQNLLYTENLPPNIKNLGRINYEYLNTVLDSYYYAHLDLLTMTSEETRKKCCQNLENLQISLGKNVSKTLTSEEYMKLQLASHQREEELGNQLGDIFYSIITPDHEEVDESIEQNMPTPTSTDDVSTTPLDMMADNTPLTTEEITKFSKLLMSMTEKFQKLTKMREDKSLPADVQAKVEQGIEICLEAGVKTGLNKGGDLSNAEKRKGISILQLALMGLDKLEIPELATASEDPEE